MTGCECGADRDCFPTWYEALSREHADPAMAVWHNPLVCAFILQHRSQLKRRFADDQYRFLQLFTHRGIEAVNAVARARRARNRGSAPALETRELDRYEPIPPGACPTAFAVSVHHLREAGGGFVTEGHAEYGKRMHAFAVATVLGWRLSAGSE